MDWSIDTVITYQRAALLRLIAGIFASLGIVGGQSVDVLPKSVYRAALFILKPAESALRRLIMVLAHRLSVTVGAVRSVSGANRARGKRADDYVPPFRLFDPRKRTGKRGRRSGPAPSISDFDEDRPRLPESSDDAENEPVPAVHLCGRLNALQRALEDLQRQAQRLARVQARRRDPQRKTRWLEPMRAGWPPGWRVRGKHEIDEVLRDCHQLATMVLQEPDTS